MKKLLKENLDLIIKTIIFSIVFSVIMLILAKCTNLPNIIKDITSKIDSCVYVEPDGREWVILFLYRLSIYFGLPIIVIIFEIIFFKKKRNLHSILLNLEAQFLSFSLISGLYYFFSLDYIFKSNIFSIKDSIVFLISFVITFVADKEIGHVIQNKEKNDS